MIALESVDLKNVNDDSSVGCDVTADDVEDIQTRKIDMAAVTVLQDCTSDMVVPHCNQVVVNTDTHCFYDRLDAPSFRPIFDVSNDHIGSPVGRTCTQ